MFVKCSLCTRHCSGTLHMLTHLMPLIIIFLILLSLPHTHTHNYPLHFTDWETKAERLINLPNATLLISGRAEIQTQKALFQCQCSELCFPTPCAQSFIPSALPAISKRSEVCSAPAALFPLHPLSP